MKGSTPLKKAREERKLTQQEVAQSVNVSIRSYKMYESGERVPRVDTAIQLADVLSVKSYQDFKKIFS